MCILILPNKATTFVYDYVLLSVIHKMSVILNLSFQYLLDGIFSEIPIDCMTIHVCFDTVDALHPSQQFSSCQEDFPSSWVEPALSSM